ncbi:MAG: hypothetical protein ACXVZR_10345 [Terriglobales bacterium]
MAVQSDVEVREKGLSLEVIGGMIWFFDFLILFFLPAGLKLGHKTGFAVVMFALAALGLALVVSGIVIRARVEKS